MKTHSIVVIGSSNTDLVIKVARIPKPGETVLGGEFARNAGGKGANQAVGAARAGGAVSFIGRVGHDDFGRRALTGLAAEGINVDHVIQDPAEPSGVALIFVGDGGENSIAVASGANARLEPADVRKGRRVFRGAKVLLVQLEIPLETVEAAVGLATAAGVRVILNPAPARPLPQSLLRRVFLLTPNESEAEILTGVRVTSEASAAEAAQRLLALGVENVIVTMGRRGAFVSGNGVRQFVPAYRIKAVDSTAAGDIFNGTLALALAEGKPLVEAARFASAAAAISVTRLGAQASAPTREQIDRFLLSGKVRRGQNIVGSNGRDGLLKWSKTRDSRREQITTTKAICSCLQPQP